MNDAIRRCPVLLADDDPSNLRFLELLLSRTGCLIESCRDGMQAYIKAERNEYALYVFDVRMPGLSGINLARFIRDAGHDAPIILVSGDGLSEDEDLTVRALGVEWISKPFNAFEFLARVKRLLAVPAEAADV